MTALAVVLLLVACAGCLYLGFAAVVASGFVAETAPDLAAWPPVTVLKPLRGDEPGLSRNLASFCEQDYPAPVQIVFGVQAADDTAIGTVKGLEADYPDHDVRLVVNPAGTGRTGKSPI